MDYERADEICDVACSKLCKHYRETGEIGFLRCSNCPLWKELSKEVRKEGLNND